MYGIELFCPSKGKKLPCYNLVVLIATFDDTKREIPLDIRLWLPKVHPECKSKPQMMKMMVEALQSEASKRALSLEGVLFSCDAAYQRSNALMETVDTAGFTLIVKVSGNLTFTVDGQRRKGKERRDLLPLEKMRQSSRLGWRYHYKHIVAVHPTLGTVMLIVSAMYNQKHKTYRRILLMTTDLQMQAPAFAYKRRWRVEIFFKSLKQELRLGVFQLRKLESIRAHFQLRSLGYLLLSQIRRFGFRLRKRWSLRKVKRWLRDALTSNMTPKAP